VGATVQAQASGRWLYPVKRWMCRSKPPGVVGPVATNRMWAMLISAGLLSTTQHRFGGAGRRTHRLIPLPVSVADDDDVTPGKCSLIRPHLDVRRWERRVRHQRISPRTPVPSGDYRQGEGRAGEDTNPRLMPRESLSWRWTQGHGWRTGRCEAVAATDQPTSVVGTPLSRGSEGTHSGRISTVRNAAIPSGVQT
jgi:hypothetical protein